MKKVTSERLAEAIQASLADWAQYSPGGVIVVALVTQDGVWSSESPIRGVDMARIVSGEMPVERVVETLTKPATYHVVSRLRKRASEGK